MSALQQTVQLMDEVIGELEGEVQTKLAQIDTVRRHRAEQAAMLNGEVPDPTGQALGTLFGKKGPFGQARPTRGPKMAQKKTAKFRAVREILRTTGRASRIEIKRRAKVHDPSPYLHLLESEGEARLTEDYGRDPGSPRSKRSVVWEWVGGEGKSPAPRVSYKGRGRGGRPKKVRGQAEEYMRGNPRGIQAEFRQRTGFSSSAISQTFHAMVRDNLIRDTGERVKWNKTNGAIVWEWIGDSKLDERLSEGLPPLRVDDDITSVAGVIDPDLRGVTGPVDVATAERRFEQAKEHLAGIGTTTIRDLRDRLGLTTQEGRDLTAAMVRHSLIELTGRRSEDGSSEIRWVGPGPGGLPAAK